MARTTKKGTDIASDGVNIILVLAVGLLISAIYNYFTERFESLELAIYTAILILVLYAIGRATGLVNINPFERLGVNTKKSKKRKR